jgi:predicted RNA-binding protein YlxR (DUF448 family)
VSKKGHVPIRTCIGCRKRRRKEEMVRLTKDPEGIFFTSGKKDLNGRGSYLCPDLICFKKAQKKGRMGRFVGMDGFPASIDPALLQRMKGSAE